MKGSLLIEKSESFQKIMSLIVDNFKLKKAADIMVANRMASCWVKMRECEEKIEQTGLITEKGISDVVYYLRQLESEFRSYYRLLQGYKSKETAQPGDFLDWLDDGKKIKSKKDKE